MLSAFGTDHVRHKQAAAQVAIANLTTDAGVSLLMQWLSDKNVVGIFIAPPCGSASRARSIPLKRKRPGDPPAPKPLRSDKHPNGLPNLSFVDRPKISKANKLYFLTSKLVQWAVAVGCIFCIENPQFSLFWQTTFMQSVIHLMNFTTFQTCMYGSKRPKRTMLGFNAEEFTVLNKMCSGVTSNHRHDSWVVHAGSNKFATSLETAYPTMLARAIAAQFVLALQNRGIRMPPETLTAIGASDDATLAAMRAQTGLQPKASRLPPLIPSFAAKVSLSGFCEDLPVAHIQYKLPAQLHVGSKPAPTVLPKGSKLLQLLPCLLPSSCVQGGVVVSEQQPSQEALSRFAQLYQDDDISRCGACESQVWGIPWSEEAFIEQMVHFGHPATVKAGFLEELQDAVDFYRCKGLHERVEYRASRLGFWLRRLHALKADEAKLKASLDKDVAIVIKQKNILLWEEMLKSIDYPDMSVVSELRDGTDLVGCTPKTGLWPSKFQPASITLDELHDIACKERSCLSQQFAGVCEGALIEQVWNKTMEEVDAGALVGPIHLDDMLRLSVLMKLYFSFSQKEAESSF
jgi:hypothetical protein